MKGSITNGIKVILLVILKIKLLYWYGTRLITISSSFKISFEPLSAMNFKSIILEVLKLFEIL